MSEREHIYLRALRAKGGGRQHLYVLLEGRYLRKNQARLFGRQGGPMCAHVSDVRNGTMVQVPVQETLTWLRRRAWKLRTPQEDQMLGTMAGAKDPTSGEQLSGVEAKGHVLWMILLGKSEQFAYEVKGQGDD